MKMQKVSLGAIVLAIVSGCFTIKEPNPISIEMPKIPAGKDVRVQLSGFETTVTTYEQSYGYTTYTGFVPGPYHRRHCHGGIYSTTVSSVELIPKTTQTAYYRDRATDLMERSGVVMQTTDPQYRVDVRFEGPFTSDSDGWSSAAWMLFSVFTADYGAQEWTAKLRIRDAKTGKLIYSKDFSQRYEALVWGPIPIFSVSGSDKTHYSTMKGWCLSMLTDIAVSEAIAFINK